MACVNLDVSLVGRVTSAVKVFLILRVNCSKKKPVSEPSTLPFALLYFICKELRHEALSVRQYHVP